MEEASSRGFIGDILVIGTLVASLWLTVERTEADEDAAAEVRKPPEVRLLPRRGEPPR